MADDEASSKRVVLKVFGSELGDAMALASGGGKRKDYRGVLEPTAAVAQCEKTGHPFKAGMECYLCGLPIPDKSLLRGSEDELYVECEHILPVTEARWFLDLWMNTRPPMDAWTKKAVSLEYDQAHRVCNQAKSNDSFIKEDKTTGNPGVNMVGIQVVLKNIQTRAQKHVGDYKDKRLNDLMKAIATTILSRTDAIKARVQQIISHINSSDGFKNPNYQNMSLLLRTALMVDPTALSPAVRKVHDDWYANAPTVQAYNRQLFDTFVQEAFMMYPQFRGENIGALFSGGLIPPELIPQVTSPQTILRFLDAYFKTAKEPDPSGKRLLTTVYYGIYIFTLSILLKQPLPPALVPNACKLHKRAAVAAANEPFVTTVLGPLSPLPPNIATQCEIHQRNEEREYRTLARELQQLSAEEDEEDEVTVDEDIEYFLGGLQPYLESQFLKEGVSATDAKSLSQRVADETASDFKETYPVGITEAKQSAADVADGIIRLAYGKYPDFARSLAKKITKFIRESRSDETMTLEGGLRARRPLYSNDPAPLLSPSPRSTSHARLRKRTRTRRARRVRTQSRRSKTR